MPRTFNVVTGIVMFPIVASSPRQAMEILKRRIDARRHEHYNPHIGMSLVEAYDAGTLNYLVMSEDRKEILCGELNGQFQEPVSRELAEALRPKVPDNLFFMTQPVFDPAVAD